MTNGKNFSYPGYSEILCGFSDPRIDSNAKKPNPNVTMPEWLNGKPAFAVPMAYSSQDAELRALDMQSFAAWLDARGWRSPVLALGNFDGLHRGHIKIIERIRRTAAGVSATGAGGAGCDVLGALACASASSCATTTLPSSSYQAGIWWPHQSWREMVQSWMFSSQWL